MPMDRFSWDASFKDYKPVGFTDSSILGASFADPHDLDVNILPFNGWDEKRKRNRMTFDTSAPFRVTDRRPLNPIGRTGISGRGLLPSWGPNHAVDPIVTRVKKGPGNQKILEWIAIQRDDTGEWSIPGGMIRDGEAEFLNGEVMVKTSCLMRIVTSKVLSQTDSEGGKVIKDKLAKLLKYTKADIVFQV